MKPMLILTTFLFFSCAENCSTSKLTIASRFTEIGKFDNHKNIQEVINYIYDCESYSIETKPESSVLSGKNNCFIQIYFNDYDPSLSRSEVDAILKDNHSNRKLVKRKLPTFAEDSNVLKKLTLRDVKLISIQCPEFSQAIDKLSR